ncbi:MAG: hypothetical protein IKT40_05960 [Bacilli bacterium]|nr:hypothetical protein [Bacilli bacterium]
MSSVFFHNDDPLLRQQPPITLFQTPNNQNTNNVNLSEAYAQMYKQQLLMEIQQQQQNQANNSKDWIGELDSKMKELDATTADVLIKDKEFSELHNSLQSLIQSELINLVRIKINTNQNAIDNIKRQMEIMKISSQKIKDEEKQNMNELNDYIKNYSNLTFDEYKKLKNGTNKQTEIITT